MHDDVSRLLMDLLGNLTHASKTITDVIRAMHRGEECCAAAPAAAPAPAAVEAPASPLDRIQEFAPGPMAVEEADEAPKKRGRRGKLTISEAELKKLYLQDGLTAKQIAEKFGVKPGTVAQRVMKLGLSKRGPSPRKGKKAK